MNPKYSDTGTVEMRVVEECGEVIQAIAKAQRFGMFSFSPSRPHRNNAEQILSEIEDLREVLDRLEKHILLQFKEDGR